MSFISDAWKFLLDENNRETLGFFGVAIVGLINLIFRHKPICSWRWAKSSNSKGEPETGRGGDGGSAKVVGSGSALGGRGGKGGAKGFGSGGKGGDAEIQGAGIAIGGDGGEGGQYARPAIGAASSLERLVLPGDLKQRVSKNMDDKYGVFLTGRGGDSYETTVIVDGREYSMNVLLRLIRIWNDSIIDKIDDLYLQSEQEWWEKAMSLYPSETRRAVEHMRSCEDRGPSDEAPPPSPYQYLSLTGFIHERGFAAP